MQTIETINAELKTQVGQQNAAPRVLVVDDDSNVLTAVGALLEAHDMKPELFSSPTQLFSSLGPEDIGCIVTDLVMPVMNGTHVQARLKEMDSHMSIIVITAHADVPTTIELMSNGAVTLLEKPFKSRSLVEAVQKAVAMSQQNFVRRKKIEFAKTAIEKLSPEELEVMKLAAAGLPNKTISIRLDMSLRTIDRRRQSALQKLEVVSVADFAVLYSQSQEEA